MFQTPHASQGSQPHNPVCPRHTHSSLLASGLVLAIFLALQSDSSANSASPYRGLWAGEISLNYAAEVTVPLDDKNVPIAPDPKVPTPTADEAHLRLILHVNGSGQVSLLKDVAILNRQTVTNLLASDSDVALVTDPQLYASFPVQPAVRIASAVFDFGDSKATEAIDAVVASVVSAVTNAIRTDTTSLATSAGRLAVQNAAAAAGTAAGNLTAGDSDVAEAFDDFLAGTNFNSAAVTLVAQSSDPTGAAQSALNAATALQNSSFFSDSRGVDMVDAVLAAIAAAGTNDTLKLAEAQNAAASFADPADNYHRFIAGKQFGDMLVAAAGAAADAAISTNATFTSISNSVQNTPAVTSAQGEVLTFKVNLYDDTRGDNAIATVLGAIIAKAASFLPASVSRDVIRDESERAGREALGTMVARYAVPSSPPGSAYTAFIRSPLYLTNVVTAAAGAAYAGIFEKANNALYTEDSIYREAKLGAVTALSSVYAEAARTARNELPMTGTFGPGQGDPRYLWTLRQTNATAQLGDPALTATIYLPANHPTNPFRHIRHPDHTSGFDIHRNLRLDFHTITNAQLLRAGFGVDKISGVYREEIFGLHKPLGPQKDTGLKVEGKFELNRISLIDTLNAR